VGVGGAGVKTKQFSKLFLNKCEKLTTTKTKNTGIFIRTQVFLFMFINENR